VIRDRWLGPSSPRRCRRFPLNRLSIGCAAIGTLSFAGDAWESIGKALNIYDPI